MFPEKHGFSNAFIFEIQHVTAYKSGRIVMPLVRVVPSTSFCVQCLWLYQDWAKFVIILMIPEPCSTHQYLDDRWSIFSDRFRTVYFIMQSHDQNSTLSLIYPWTWDCLIGGGKRSPRVNLTTIPLQPFASSSTT